MSVLRTQEQLHFNDTFSFASGNGFAVAAMLTAYPDDGAAREIDPRIGELVFRYERWGIDSKGDFFEATTELPTHFCSAEELGLASGSS